MSQADIARTVILGLAICFAGFGAGLIVGDCKQKHGRMIAIGWWCSGACLAAGAGGICALVFLN